MEKINIAEILKDCPKGMELYSPIFGTVYFEGIRDTGRAILIDVTTSCNTSVQFYSDGKFNTYYSESEVTLFPSKSQRDWSKFQRPFKDGDIIYTKTRENINWLSIYKELEGSNIRTYADISLNNNLRFYYNLLSDNILCYKEEVTEQRLATEEEKQKLFQTINNNGYKWNPETKTLEDLPKFKVGDKVKSIFNNCQYIITELTNTHYTLVEVNHKLKYTEPIIDDKNWELVPNKFDINTLVPFKSEVLVRNSDSGFWKPAFWGTYEAEKSNEHQYRNYLTTEGFVRYCIPYNDETKQLLGTTNNCDDFYKTW